MAYDPLSADILADVTISATTYIVKAFNDAGASANEVTYTTSSGAWRGRRFTAGERTATMTIERANAAQAAPTQDTVFSYRGNDWVIKQVGVTASSDAATTFDLTLGWVSATA